MSTPIPGFRHHVVQPADAPGLACRFLMPDDFRSADLPQEDPDFTTPNVFRPLAVTAAPYGPLVFSLAARPAFSDGTVAEWLGYLCGVEGYRHGPMRTVQVGRHPGVECDAVQQGEGITLQMRLLLLEDGGRLFQASAMAPEALWPAAEPTFERMLASLELGDPRGAGVPLQPGEPPPGSTPTPTPDGAGLADEARTALALAADAGSFDPEHPVNARLRDLGGGLVPRVVSADPVTRCARLGCGALGGFLTVPFGWHVVDDGRRVLVFDRARGVQIHLSQFLHEGRSASQLARDAMKEVLESQPGLESIELELDGIYAAGVRNLVLERERLDQYVLVRDLGRPTTHLMARVTVPPDDLVRGLNLTGDLLAGFEPMESLAAPE